MLHPAPGRWHEPQLRPLLPRLWKNGPVRSTLPVLLKVAENPVGLGKLKSFGRTTAARSAPVSAMAEVFSPASPQPAAKGRAQSSDIQRAVFPRIMTLTLPF